MLRGELCGPADGYGGCLSHCSPARWVVVGGARDWRGCLWSFLEDIIDGRVVRDVCDVAVSVWLSLGWVLEWR